MIAAQFPHRRIVMPTYRVVSKTDAATLEAAAQFILDDICLDLTDHRCSFRSGFRKQ
jgi:hypothetical protein